MDVLKKESQLSYLKYSSVAGVSYQIEVNKRDLKKVPHDWIKLSQTKMVSRFRSPEVIRLVQELDKCKEELDLACDEAFKDFLAQVVGNGNYERFRMIVQALAELDCLMSLAATSSQPHYVRAEYVDRPCLEITQGRHPMVEQVLLDGYVANDSHLSADAERALIITGPNMGGKSSYVRQLALIAIMAQVGSYVPADRARLGTFDAVYTRMGAYDNIMSGESTFKVELKECADIMKNATERSLVILDEIGRGTGTMDGVAIAYAVLAHFIEDIKALTLFVTHYPSLAAFEHAFPGTVRNYHMGFIESKPDDNDDEAAATGNSEITFLYTLDPGIAHKSYGLNVARLAGIPDSILTSARVKSSELERLVADRGVPAFMAEMVRKALDPAEQPGTELTSEQVERLRASIGAVAE